MRDKILVVGGYGAVGQVICDELGNKFPGKVVAAGRSYQKAKQFSLKTNGKVLPRAFDVSSEKDLDENLEDISLVVMSLDQKNTKFIETCIKTGIHYIDITASYSFLKLIEKLDDKAKNSESTVVLSVGIAPGLTNLLVKHSKSQFDSIDIADIFIMLGLGDKHGKAVVEWTIDNINTEFNIIENGSLKKVKSFEDGKKTEFPANLGKRTAFRFDFNDQHVVPKTLGVKSSSTRLCFDSTFFTHTFAGLKKIGFFNLLKINLFRKGFIKIFENFHWGSDIFIAKVDAIGTKNEKVKKYECSLSGRKEGITTGKVAAIVAEYLYQKDFPYGVYHIEQLFEPDEIIGSLGKDLKVYF